MFKTLGLVLKVIVFSVLILVFAHKIHFGEKTISDEIRSKMAHAENSQIFQNAKLWASGLVADAKQGESHYRKVIPHQIEQTLIKTPPDEQFMPTERQKLRALISELNKPDHPPKEKSN